MYNLPVMVNISRPTAAVIGATGYTGQELVRLLGAHPRLRLGFATSESETGQRVPGAALRYVDVGSVPLDAVDVVFTCLPHGEAETWSVRARQAGARVVDLSSDLRAGAHGAVYGVPELWRDCIREQPLVANPGCYPTGILLSLAPLLRAGQVDTNQPIMIDAASGVTGAGRGAKRDLLFGEVAEDYRAYGVGNAHRHVPEIASGLARIVTGAAPPFVFTPHLLPVRRGILETMYIPVEAGFDAGAARQILSEAYAAEPYVEVFDEGLPALRDAVGRNVVCVGFADVAGVGGRTLLCVAAFDNLLKGAAGQALQNANLMLGLPETDGIPA